MRLPHILRYEIRPWKPEPTPKPEEWWIVACDSADKLTEEQAKRVAEAMGGDFRAVRVREVIEGE